MEKFVDSYLKSIPKPEVIFSSKFSDKTEISIVIPLYCEQESISKTLLSLEKQIFKNFEVVCVDNNSIDDTVDVVNKLRSKISYPLSLLKEENPGPGAARKAGADFVLKRVLSISKEIVSNYYIANTDADCTPPKEWLGKIIEVFKDRSVGMCGGPHTASKKIDQTINQKLGIVNYFKEVADLNNRIAASGIGKLKFSGPNNAIRLEAYTKAGGMRQPVKKDGSIDLKETNDLAKRVESAGYKLEYLPCYMVSSRRRHLMELLKGRSMYFQGNGKDKHFIVIPEKESTLLQQALQTVPKEKWIDYRQNSLINKVIENTIKKTKKEYLAQ